eukprot:gene19148-21067_t
MVEQHHLDLLSAGQKVLVLWASAHPPVNIENVITQLRKIVGDKGKVQVEHVDILSQSQHSKSSFDVAMSGLLSPSAYIHNTDILAEIARVLKPNAKLLIREPTGGRSAEKLISTLKISGFIKATEPKFNQLANESIQMIEMCESKYHIAISAQKKTVDPNVAKVWTLSAQDVNEEDMDIIDSDALLEQEDLIKPDPASLKTGCGPKSGKKKACKNCTCGMADSESSPSTKPVGSSKPVKKSACGNCYLGDAFRCGGCPYVGMPPFKPGEQVLLPKNMLQADV